MKRFLSVLLIVCMFMPAASAWGESNEKVTADGTEIVVGLENFEAANIYNGEFTDVESSAWYSDGVQAAFEYGLMTGNSETVFNPTGKITVAEVLVIASRMDDIYYGGDGDFIQGTPWYQVYVDYALENSLIYVDEFSDYTVAATRAQFATILSRVLPSEELKAINIIGNIPDVPMSADYSPSVRLLYTAGILTGSDKYGSFHPNDTIQRCEVATIVTRMVDVTQRKNIVLEVKPAEAKGMALTGKTTIYVGDTTSWTAKAEPDGATLEKVTWASGNPGVASIDSNGKITAHKAGQSHITASSGKFKKTVLLTVKTRPAAKSVQLAGKTSVVVGSSVKWTATVSPSDASQWVHWTSGNTSVATVDQNGNIHGLKAGISDITATATNGVKKTVRVTVTAAYTQSGGYSSSQNSATTASYEYSYNDLVYLVTEMTDIMDAIEDATAYTKKVVQYTAKFDDANATYYANRAASRVTALQSKAYALLKFVRSKERQSFTFTDGSFMTLEEGFENLCSEIDGVARFGRASTTLEALELSNEILETAIPAISIVKMLEAMEE